VFRKKISCGIGQNLKNLKNGETSVQETVAYVEYPVSLWIFDISPIANSKPRSKVHHEAPKAVWIGFLIRVRGL